MRRLLLLFTLLLAACQTETVAPPPDPLALVTEAGDHIRASETFRLEVLSSGAPYPVQTDFGPDVLFRQIKAQYVAPDTLQGSVRLVVAGIPADVDVYAAGTEQWFRNAVLTGGQWANQAFAPGFNPQVLIADDTGFQSALKSLIELEYVGEESLEDGTAVYHLKGVARGEDIATLLASLVVIEGDPHVDVYIDREQRLPVRFVITLPNDETDPTVWTLDVYDVNADPELNPPGA
ncbi:MAG: LppX_LprAFG lipoprotein [Anaerolineae bacterium]|nr:LppX_LprAFG lipoprotein [Anaerolineae bacterium]